MMCFSTYSSKGERHIPANACGESKIVPQPGAVGFVERRDLDDPFDNETGGDVLEAEVDIPR
jgi:hypothetical protein